jgi:hypothetical protein
VKVSEEMNIWSEFSCNSKIMIVRIYTSAWNISEEVTLQLNFKLACVGNYKYELKLG